LIKEKKCIFAASFPMKRYVFLPHIVSKNIYAERGEAAKK
jgi:hypothetical protein